MPTGGPANYAEHMILMTPFCKFFNSPLSYLSDTNNRFKLDNQFVLDQKEKEIRWRSKLVRQQECPCSVPGLSHKPHGLPTTLKLPPKP